MNALRALYVRLALSSIRSRVLMIALLPALLAEFGMVAYFTTQALDAAERDLHTRASNAVHHLAATLPYALVSGDMALTQSLLRSETENSQLAFARVTDARGQTLASTGDSLRAARPDGLHRQHAAIRMPAADFKDDPLFVVSASPAADLLGQIDIGVTLDQIDAFRRDTLIHAALLMLVALTLTGALAWRLSNRLARQLHHVGQVVERLACDDLTVRTHLPPTGEVGALAAGVNDMAEALQRHRGEL
ncbi:MAG TPA: HAMP domain-containing protein, partial [Thiobacillus sp.]